MADQKMPTHIMGVSLLHKCNFKCAHCGYIYIGDAEDHIIRPGYRLTWDQVMTAIKDCNSLKDSLWNMNYTGGEPTLWGEGDRDLVDVLIATARANVLPTFNTNGSHFDDYGRCSRFFRRYLDHCDVPLKTFISMDKFHKNYNEQTGRAKSLDNIVKFWESISEDQRKLIPVHVVVIVTKDPESSLPAEMKQYYGFKGITFGDFPMMNIGKARDLKEQLPEPPSFKFPRYEGKGPGVLTLVGDDYYSGNKKLGKLGRMMDLYPNG